MRIFTFPVGVYEANCHLLWDEESRKALIVDAGGNPEKIIQEVEKRGLHPLALLLTHAHLDHISAVPAVCSRFGIPVWCHPMELPLYLNRERMGLPYLPPVDDLPKPLENLPEMPESLAFKLLFTPGHTPGGVCYYLENEKVLLSGDTLFAGSVGRTDLPGGDTSTLIDSIMRRLMTLPDDTRVLPGHGESTTIGDERKFNPYLVNHK